MFESKYLNAVLEPFYYTLSFLKIKVRFFCLFLIFMAPFIKVFSQKYLLFDETKIPKENLALLINKTDVGIIKIDNKELNKICPVRMYLLPGEYTIVVFKILMDKPYLINGNSFATTIILNIKVEKGHKYKIDYKSDSKKPLIEYLYIIHDIAPFIYDITDDNKIVSDIVESSFNEIDYHYNRYADKIRREIIWENISNVKIHTIDLSGNILVYEMEVDYENLRPYIREIIDKHNWYGKEDKIKLGYRFCKLRDNTYVGYCNDYDIFINCGNYWYDIKYHKYRNSILY